MAASTAGCCEQARTFKLRPRCRHRWQPHVPLPTGSSLVKLCQCPPLLALGPDLAVVTPSIPFVPLRRPADCEMAYLPLISLPLPGPLIHVQLWPTTEWPTCCWRTRAAAAPLHPAMQQRTSPDRCQGLLQQSVGRHRGMCRTWRNGGVRRAVLNGLAAKSGGGLDA